MIDLGSWAETLGLRRKKSFVERVQDAAEDVLDSVTDTMKPVLRRSSKARRPRGFEMPDMKMPDMRMPSMSKMHLPDVSMPEIKLPDMKMPDVRLPDVRLPNVHAGEMASDAADRVKYTATATGAAAVGVAAGIGGFFAAMIGWIWSVTVFFVKTGLLVGVAYAGWQWLQSRKTQDSWNSSTGSSDFSSSTYGTVKPSAPSAATTAAAR